MLKAIPLLAGATAVWMLRLGLFFGLFGLNAATGGVAGAIVGWVPFIGPAVAGTIVAAGSVVGITINFCLMLNANVFLTVIFMQAYKKGRTKGRIEAAILRRMLISFLAAPVPVVNLLPWEVVSMALSARDIAKQEAKAERKSGRSAQGEFDTEEERDEAEESAAEQTPLPQRRVTAPVALASEDVEEGVGERPENGSRSNVIPLRRNPRFSDITPRSAPQPVQDYAQAA